MTKGGTAILRLEGVAKSYGATRVLEPLDLEILDGEFLTILGPSGSGKTTILRLIGGFAKPDAGRILLDGRDITADPAFARPFNTVFQDYALFPHMTVRRNVEFGLRVRKLARPEIVRRVDEVLEIVGLSHLADRYPADMSGGQRQRAALARAIVCEPRIILLDEPLAALDAERRRSMRAFLKDLQRRIGTSFLFITHDQEEAIAVSDRIVVTNEGRIEQIGSPEDVYRKPASRFVAGFFGENNIIPWEAVTGELLSAVRKSVLGKGLRAAAIAIRPESLRIVAADQARAMADIDTVSFLGATTEVLLRLAGHRFRVRFPTSHCEQVLRANGSVGVQWADADVMVLPR